MSSCHETWIHIRKRLITAGWADGQTEKCTHNDRELITQERTNDRVHSNGWHMDESIHRKRCTEGAVEAGRWGYFNRHIIVKWKLQIRPCQDTKTSFCTTFSSFMDHFLSLSAVNIVGCHDWNKWRFYGKSPLINGFHWFLTINNYN